MQNCWHSGSSTVPSWILSSATGPVLLPFRWGRALTFHLWISVQKAEHHHIHNRWWLLLPERTLFFSSFCFCLSSRADRRFSALIRCSSSFLRRPSSCCSLSCRAFSSFSSHWVFLAAKIGQKNMVKRVRFYLKSTGQRSPLSLPCPFRIL